MSNVRIAPVGAASVFRSPGIGDRRWKRLEPPDAARRVKLANRRDSLAHPPADRGTARTREYVDRAAQMVDGQRGSHAGLEAVFDNLYRRAPHVVG